MKKTTIPTRSKYNAKSIWIDDPRTGQPVKLRSLLEKYAFNKLIENNIEFEYEPRKFILLDDFYHEYDCWEKRKVGGKYIFSTMKTHVLPINYVPDFMGKNWIIETKGMRTSDFDLKWKMFKAYLVANRLQYDLFLPTSQKEVNLVVDIIKR